MFRVVAGSERDPFSDLGFELGAQITAPSLRHGHIVEQQVHSEASARSGGGGKREDAMNDVRLPYPVHPEDSARGSTLGLQPWHIETGRAEQLNHPAVAHVLDSGPAPHVKGFPLRV